MVASRLCIALKKLTIQVTGMLPLYHPLLTFSGNESYAVKIFFVRFGQGDTCHRRLPLFSTGTRLFGEDVRVGVREGYVHDHHLATLFIEFVDDLS